MNYRRDIDGLRSVAILPVILFHAGFGIFPGGFLGVDIFFVISGYLITSILLIEMEKDQFSVVYFYERRARRILPALFVVLFVTYLAGFFFMPSFEFKEFSQSLVSVVVFLSNIFFYLETDYFSLAAEEMPLLHTWSLAIEEQFYIFFPPILYFIWRFTNKYILLALSIFSLLSFGSLLVLNILGHDSASFYWPISRAWELLAGSISAFIAYKYGNKIKPNRFIADLALFILIACLFFWQKQFSHPGFLTIIPVTSTCLLIIFSSKISFSYRFLTAPFMVFIGLISYSLYLWHQPLFAFLRMKTVGNPSSSQILFTILIIFIAAYLSYRFVEVPYKNKKKYNRKFVFSVSSFFLSIFLSLGLAGHVSNGIENRYSIRESYIETIQHSPFRKKCHSNDKKYIEPSKSCKYFGKNVSLAIFGDSHTVEPAYALADLIKDKDTGLSHHSYSGCPPALNYKVLGKELCTQWLNETLRFLENSPQIETVVVAFRYSYGIYGDNIKTFPMVPGTVTLDIDSPEHLTEEQKLAMYWLSLKEIIVRLIQSNKKVILFEPIPELPTHISKAITPFSIVGDSAFLDLNTSTTKEYYEKRHRYILAKLRSLQKNDNLILVNIYELLCHEGGCPAVIGDTAIYFDDDHLSIAGSKILFERLLKTVSL